MPDLTYRPLVFHTPLGLDLQEVLQGQRVACYEQPQTCIASSRSPIKAPAPLFMDSRGGIEPRQAYSPIGHERGRITRCRCIFSYQSQRCRMSPYGAPGGSHISQERHAPSGHRWLFAGPLTRLAVSCSRRSAAKSSHKPRRALARPAESHRQVAGGEKDQGGCKSYVPLIFSHHISNHLRHLDLIFIAPAENGVGDVQCKASITG